MTRRRSPAVLALVDETPAPVPPPPSTAYEYEQRQRIAAIDWTAVHIRGDRAATVQLGETKRGRWS